MTMSDPNVRAAKRNPHNALYIAGTKLIWPHLQFANRSPRILSPDARADIETGIGTLNAALKLRPDSFENWAEEEKGKRKKGHKPL
jgi:hypothetical protein